MACCYWVTKSYINIKIFIKKTQKTMQKKGEHQIINWPLFYFCLQTMNADPYRGPWGGARCRDSPSQVWHISLLDDQMIFLWPCFMFQYSLGPSVLF